LSTPLLKVIFERRSIRKFDRHKEIPEDFIRKILEAGINAPSAGNVQPRTFIVINDETVKAKLYELCENQKFMLEAPLWVVICVDLHRHLRAVELSGVEYRYTGMLPYTFGVLDAALSLENMVITAEALGLGSVIIGSIIEHPEKVSQILKLPTHCLALSILCVGYPKEKPPKRSKWNYETIVCENEYKEITKEEVEKYWKELTTRESQRNGRKIGENYGTTYAAKYTEDFVRKTSKKLADYLIKQGLIKTIL